MSDSISGRCEWGDAIVGRVPRIGRTPEVFGAAISRFKRAHAAYSAAATEANRAIAARDKAIGVLAEADANVDGAVIILGNKMVGAGMTPASSPFRGYSRFSPANLVALKYVDEYREVTNLLLKVEEVPGLADAVKKAARAVRSAMALANKAIDALNAPQTRMTQALAARETLQPEWESALHSVKTQGNAAWESTPAKLTAFLAPAPAAQRGTRMRVTVRTKKPSKSSKSSKSTRSKKPVPATSTATA